MDDHPPQVRSGTQPQGRFDEAHPVGHERSDVSLRGIFLFTGILAASSVAILLLLGGLMALFARQERRLEQLRPPMFTDESGQFPAPRLQGNPAVDTAEFLARARKTLNSYGWVDRKAGIARIPIDRAIEILAQKGLPERKDGPKPGLKP
jgi:hypothetical protein